MGEYQLSRSTIIQTNEKALYPPVLDSIDADREIKKVECSLRNK